MMKKILVLLNIVLFLVACSGSSDKARDISSEKDGIKGEMVKNANDITGRFHLPPLTKPGEGAYLKGRLIYPLDSKPTPQCHASTIAETPSGLVAAFFAGTHERNDDVGIRVSRMVGGEWTWPEEVANGVQNDTLRFPTWNPVLFQPKDGPLMLFYKVGRSPRSWWGMLITSNDDGKTWSMPVKLGEDEKVGHLLGPVKNKPIQLEDGTIICPSSVEIRYKRKDKSEEREVDWLVHFEITRDFGKTWEVVGPINDGKTFDAIQPSLLTYTDDSMQVLCRTLNGVIAQSWSDDGGKTWSEMTATELPNPNSGTDAVTLKDHRQLLVYNHSTESGDEPKGRNILNLAISENGIDWKPVMTLENEPVEKGYAYPAIIQASDGLVHITYTYMRQSIKHVVIDPDQL